MNGIINVQRLQTQTGGPVELTGQSAAKAWCSWRKTTNLGVQASFNVSSYVDVSTTVSTINLTNAMAVTDGYSLTVASNESSSGRTNWGGVATNIGTLDVGAFNVNNSNADPYYNSATVQGELA